MKITIIDDEKLLADSIKKKLDKEGFSVNVHYCYKSFMKKINEIADLYIIDISLGDGSGFDIIKELRKSSVKPIIITSGFNDVNKKVYGLNIGADDYLAKPFMPLELIARINALLRRNQESNVKSHIIHKEIIVDRNLKSIKLRGHDFHTTNKEYQIIEYFLLNKGKLITKEELINDIWGDFDMFGTVKDNTIFVTISRIRKKLGDNFDLQTNPNKGYFLNE